MVDKISTVHIQQSEYDRFGLCRAPLGESDFMPEDELIGMGELPGNLCVDCVEELAVPSDRIISELISALDEMSDKLRTQLVVKRALSGAPADPVIWRKTT